MSQSASSQPSLSSSNSSLLQDSPRSPPIPQITQTPQVPISVTRALPGQLVPLTIPTSLTHAASPLLQTTLQQITPALPSSTPLTPVAPATPSTPPAQPWFSASENVIIDIEMDDPDESPAPKPQPLQKGSETSANGQPIQREGLHIHYGTDGKRLCSYSKKLCQQRRMESYGYCIKHILEDPSAPFTQCQFNSKQTRKQCTNPVSIKEQDTRYCAAHKQILGLMPRKIPQQKKSKKKLNESGTTTISNPDLVRQNHKKLARILNKQGILHSAAFQAMRYSASSIPAVPVRSLSSSSSSLSLSVTSPTSTPNIASSSDSITSPLIASMPVARIPSPPMSPTLPLQPTLSTSNGVKPVVSPLSLSTSSTSVSFPTSPTSSTSPVSPVIPSTPSTPSFLAAFPSTTTTAQQSPLLSSIATTTPTMPIQSPISVPIPTPVHVTRIVTTPSAISRPIIATPTNQPILFNYIIHSDTESSSSFPSSSSSSESEKASDEDDPADPDPFFSGEFLQVSNFDSDSDSDYFREIHIVTEEELIRRRRDKIRKLLKLYKSQFKRLEDKLKTRHHRYVKGKQKSNEKKSTLKTSSPKVKLEDEAYDGSSSESESKDGKDVKEKGKSQSTPKTCSAPNCNATRLLPTSYCFSHILLDTNQKLFKSCAYSDANTTCSHPILYSQSPPLCTAHLNTKKRKETDTDSTRSPTKILKTETPTQPHLPSLLQSPVAATFPIKTTVPLPKPIQSLLKPVAVASPIVTTTVPMVTPFFQSTPIATSSFTQLPQQQIQPLTQQVPSQQPQQVPQAQTQAQAQVQQIQPIPHPQPQSQQPVQVPQPIQPIPSTPTPVPAPSRSPITSPFTAPVVSSPTSPPTTTSNVTPSQSIPANFISARLASTFSTQSQILLGQIQEKNSSNTSPTPTIPTLTPTTIPTPTAPSLTPTPSLPTPSSPPTPSDSSKNP